MKKIAVLILCSLALTAVITPAHAVKGRKGASDEAYEHASDQAIFNRVGDWFATLGKTEEEKEAIISERKSKREAARIKKETGKKQRELQRNQEKEQREIKGKSGKKK
jgi:hypothetical protein